MPNNGYAFVQDGFHSGMCRRKLVNFLFKPIYGGTGIIASQSFTNDPRVAQQPMLPETHLVALN
jgi:hypothetical protein